MNVGSWYWKPQKVSLLLRRNSVKGNKVRNLRWIFSFFLLFMAPCFSQENMMQDLTAVRELCMKLDQTRESLSRQLAVKSLDHEQVGLQDCCNIVTILEQYSDIMT